MDRALEPLALDPELIEAWFERFDLYCSTQSVLDYDYDMYPLSVSA